MSEYWAQPPAPQSKKPKKAIEIVFLKCKEVDGVKVTKDYLNIDT